MIEKTTKIEELRYFSPFVRLKDQYTDLITSDVFFCDLNQQQQLFLYMASSEDVKVKATSWIMLPKNIPAKRMYFSKKQLDQKYSTCITLTGEVFTSPNAIKLNNRLETKNIFSGTSGEIFLLFFSNLICFSYRYFSHSAI